jgi:prevent-host-death family protein
MIIDSHIGDATMKELQLKDAKATLSAVVDQAVAGEPTVITRHGRKEAVVVSFEEWERVSKVPSFADLLLAFPGDRDDIPERSRKPARALRDAGG